MVAAPDLFVGPHRSDEREPRILLENVSFKDYVILGDVLGHRPRLRMTYVEGRLELLVVSRTHEELKKVIARLLELHALLRGVRITGFGQATHRSEVADRGLEPDECYCVDKVTPIPDLALEVVVSSPLLDKLDVYRGLSVREVWVHERGRFSVWHLEGERYVAATSSRFFPDMDVDLLADHVAMPDQDDAVRAYWDHLRGQGVSL